RARAAEVAGEALDLRQRAAVLQRVEVVADPPQDADVHALSPGYFRARARFRARGRAGGPAPAASRTLRAPSRPTPPWTRAVRARHIGSGSASPGKSRLRPMIAPRTLAPAARPEAKSWRVAAGDSRAGPPRSRMGRVVARHTRSKPSP